MKTNPKHLLEQWLEKALHDELAAKVLINYRPLILDTACFHCQQAVEKYLKAFLLFKNYDFPKIHDVAVLKKLCLKLDKDFEMIDLKDLRYYAVGVRYPDEYLTPSLKETKGYLRIVLQVKKLVLKKIKV